jgi:GrpB-like predicted nucleotidyltransferase (UPF0157 family)
MMHAANRLSWRRVIVVPYDPQWTEEFARASAEIKTALGDTLLEIHHIGSTAIPGMWAKPVIDLLPVVEDLAALDARAAEMESLGYEVMGEFGIPGRRYFRRDNAAGERTHHVHAFQRGSPHVVRHLAFRDFMRAHPESAREYAELKCRLAAAHPDDIEAYMDGKDAFVKRMEAQAVAWASARDADLPPDRQMQPQNDAAT